MLVNIYRSEKVVEKQTHEFVAREESVDDGRSDEATSTEYDYEREFGGHVNGSPRRRRGTEIRKG